MSLDVYAHSRVFQLEQRPDLVRLDELGVRPLHRAFHLDKNWRISGELATGQWYLGPGGQDLHWALGSFGTFHAFRQGLMRATGWNGTILDHELIGFFKASDQNQAFGPDACGRILVGLQRWRETGRRWAKGHWTDGYTLADWGRVYESLETSFELGADGGAVIFC